jgi:hypothetical protein
MPSFRARLLVPVLVGLLPALTAFAAQPAPRPAKLAVLVVFDQLRGDYLMKWQDLLGEGGFRRLCQDGAWFQNCHYPYASTMTGAGHASMLTGCSPDRHGIVGNEWHDRDTGEEVYCAATERYRRVPPPAKVVKRATAGAPDLLLAPTLGDALKEQTGGRGKVVAISFKDRSAVLPAGHRPDACYWLDGTTGTFVTSTYYRDRLHPWVEQFNVEKPADRWFGKAWDRLRPDVDYFLRAGLDDVAAEGKGKAQGRTFPHPMTGGLQEPGKEYYEALYNSPFGNDLLLDLAKRAVDGEALGADDVPDLLSVSFSSNDPVGHCYGPDSQEVLDTTLRSDLIIKELLAFLDAKVGRGNYVLALTADHGVCPLPEVAQAKHPEAVRVNPTEQLLAARDFLRRTFSPADEKAKWIQTTSGYWMYLNRALIRQYGVDAAKVEDALAGWLKQQPEVLTAYTRTQLMQPASADDDLGRRVRKSFHADRCGDVAVIFKPYRLPSTSLTGTTHGTPFDYDTHVPLLAYGPGIGGGPRREAVTPQAAAAVLAHGLGIKPPAQAEAPLPASLAK